jgi:hypothetical protein
MMATGLGAFVKGAVEGYKTSKEMSRMDALQKREEERDERERQRFALEQTRAQREEEQAKIASEAQAEALSVLEDAKRGTGKFASLADPAALQAQQQATQSVEQKAGMSYDRAEARRLGRTGVDETQTASVTPQEENLFKSGGEGLYKNQTAADNLKYQLIGDAMKKSLLAKGDFGRAMMVDQDVEKMKEQGYELVRKKAAALVMAGAPPDSVIPALQKVYGFVDDGKSIDPTKSTYDAKTGTYNLSVVDQKTGKVEMRPLNQQSMLSALNQLDPVKVLELNIGSQRRTEDLAIAAANRKEDVALQREKIGVERIGAIATRDLRSAQKAALEDQVKGADVRAKVESITKSFPNADRVLKLEESVGPDVEATKLSIQNDTVGRNIAVNLASLNPKTDPQILIGAAKAAASGKLPARKSDPKTGRSYFDYGGVQIFAD